MDNASSGSPCDLAGDYSQAVRVHPRRSRFGIPGGHIGLLALICCCHSALAQAIASQDNIETVEIIADRQNLVGSADTSSEGVVVKDELDLLPAFRPGQLFETVPGLTVTSHSGEGKANQYLLRGFNLDHGTDLGVFVDGMPVNEPSHAHGQGYSDLNFLIPELAAGVDFTKGPYFANAGDFSAVGVVRTRLLDAVGDQATAASGMLGYERGFVSAAREIGTDTLLGATEFVHYDGPWVRPDDMRKFNVILRYIHGDADNGLTATLMFYRGSWNATTDQPERAIAEGLISRFGSLDPSDGGEAMRTSLSVQYHVPLLGGQIGVNAYAINNRLTLLNNFTHFLVDPIDGDQEAQNEVRDTLGTAFNYRNSNDVIGLQNDFLLGASDRDDQNHVYRYHTKARQYLSTFEDDHLHLDNGSFYVQDVVHWTSWLRTLTGVREDVIEGGDIGTNGGTAEQWLFQPKGDIIVTPLDWLEGYASAGLGFHSDDLRGVTRAASSGTAGAPLMAKQMGEELGLRANILPSLTATFTYFYMKAQSETTYDADVGQDSAGPGSRHTGFEINTTWQALHWLEFYSSLALSHARYTVEADDGAGGHLGYYIPNAPSVIGSLAAYVKDMGSWSGGLEYRYLGTFPVTPDNSIQGKGYGEWNLDIAYVLDDNWKFGLGLYNALDTHANAAEFYYYDRLPGEPAGGVGDLHVHPLEPRSVRFNISRSLG